MLDECKVSLVEGILFGSVAAIQSDFLGVVDKTRVLEAELTLKTGLVGNILAKGRREHAHHVGGELDEKRHEDDALAADALGERVRIDGLTDGVLVDDLMDWVVGIRTISSIGFAKLL